MDDGTTVKRHRKGDIVEIFGKNYQVCSWYGSWYLSGHPSRVSNDHMLKDLGSSNKEIIAEMAGGREGNKLSGQFPEVGSLDTLNKIIHTLHNITV